MNKSRLTKNYKKMNSIKNKMNFSITAVVLMSVITASLIFYVFAKNQVNEKYINEGQKNLMQAILMLNNTFDDAEVAINIVVKQLESRKWNIAGLNKDNYFEMLSLVQENIKNSSTLYFGMENGDFYLAPIRYVAEDYDPTIRSWYINSTEMPMSIVWTEPYVDHGTGELTISASKYVKPYNSKLSGVVGIDILLSEINKVVESSKIGKYGYIMVVSTNGNVLSHPDADKRGKSISDLNIDINIENIVKSNDEIYSNSNNIYIGKTFDTGKFSVIAVIDKQDISDSMTNILLLIIVVTFLFIVIIELIIFKIASSIINPIMKLKQVMLKVENGDYNVKCDLVADDEIKILVDGFNNMIQSINEKNIEMQALYEELYASEQTLQDQYDSLFEQSEFIKKSENRYRLIFDASKEGLWDADENWNITYLTPNWYNDYFTSVKEKTLDAWHSLIHPEDVLNVKNQVKAHMENKTSHYKTEYRIQNLKGEYRWIEAIGMAQFDENGNFKSMSGSHLDITKRKNFEFKILDMAYSDYLTKANNQLYFREELEKYLSEGGKGSILYMDLDNFKNINDTYGHSIGDYVIVEISKRLLYLSTSKYIISRFSGDEFVILIKEITEVDKIIDIVDELLSEIKISIKRGSISIKVSASFGITIFPKDGENVDTLLQNADIAMYQAKKIQNKSYYIFDDTIKKIVQREMQLENGLKNSIDNSELEVYYQPIIDMNNQSIKGFEALARWKSKELGLIYPDEFIPIAEKSGFINEIGFEVLRKSCAFLKEMEDIFEYPFEISVNISVVQLMQDYFVNEVLRIIDEYTIAYPRITLEITETVMLETDENILGKLYYLHGKGIHISLDDFGTGYSSVKNLIRLPINFIKIDKSIMNESISKEHVFSLLESIVEYAHKMNIKVVGEGIENDYALLKVKQLAIDYAQGYYYSKPIDKNEIVNLIHEFWK